MAPENLKILVMILNALLVVMGGCLINAFCQAGLTRKRKGLFIILGISGAIIAALLNSLGNPPPAEIYTYFILGLGYLFSFVSLIKLWKAWPGSKATTSEAEIRRELLEGITENIESRLKSSWCDLAIIPRSSKLSPEHSPYSSNSDGFFIRVKRYFIGITGLEILLEPQKPIDEIFQKPEVEGKLLILGDPGSGKTTELLKLAQSLCKSAINDKHQPIPIIFELSAWEPNLTIQEWLISELKIKYNINPELADKWLQLDKIIPLLDGLDELKNLKNKCIEAINQFQSHSQYNQKYLVICSRIADYETCTHKLNLKGAVRLTELADQDIENYLKQRNGSHLWQDIKADPDGFLKLAKTPLLLYLIREAYPQGITTQKRRCKNDSERKDYQAECQATLFNVYVDQKLAEHHDNFGYSPSQTKHYLSWLAKTLRRHQTTEFFIEKMQPTWLETKAKWYWYWLIVGLIRVLIGGLIVGIIFGLIEGFVFGLIGGLTVSIIGGLVVGLTYDSSRIIALTEAIYLSSENFQRSLYLGFNFYFYSGFVFGLIGGLIQGLIRGIFSGIIFGFFCFLMVLILGTKADINIRNRPNQGIWESCNKALLIAAFSTPAMVLLSILLIKIGEQEYSLVETIIFSLGMGVILGFCGGGEACLQHFALRLILWWSGTIPWNYANFLSYASERGLLKQSGGGYRFYHDLLREHIAGDASTEPEVYYPSKSNKLNWVSRIILLALLFIQGISIPQIALNFDRNYIFKILQKQDIIFVDRITYKYRNFNRGNIVFSFINYEDEIDTWVYYSYFLVVGLPGETIEIKEGTLYINNKLFKGDSIPIPHKYNLKSIQIPADSYFIIGENPNFDKPELLGGSVVRKDIKGQVVFRLWPPERFGFLNADE